MLCALVDHTDAIIDKKENTKKTCLNKIMGKFSRTQTENQNKSDRGNCFSCNLCFNYFKIEERPLKL